MENRGVVGSGDERVLADHLEGGKDVLESAEVEGGKGWVGIAEFFVKEGVGCKRVGGELPEEMVASLLEFLYVV